MSLEQEAETLTEQLIDLPVPLYQLLRFLLSVRQSFLELLYMLLLVFIALAHLIDQLLHHAYVALLWNRIASRWAAVLKVRERQQLR